MFLCLEFGDSETVKTVFSNSITTQTFSAVMLVQKNYWTSTATVTSHFALSNIILRNVTGGYYGQSNVIQVQLLYLLGTSFLNIPFTENQTQT
jgi:hypothetical protein